MIISVREMQSSDIELIVDYFANADSEFLKRMGADKSKLPNKNEWIAKLESELNKSIQEIDFYYIIWLLDGNPIGHSNINNITYGENATMHLHIWESENRKAGIGTKLIKQTIPYYFKNFKLQKLICEPYAENPAPNKILEKVGFKFIKQYQSAPGWINFYQAVNRFELSNKEYGGL